MTDFRLCLTCPSHSQANFYHYALQLISDQFEFTIAHLRYSLGGDRPSQTTNHAMSEKFFGFYELMSWFEVIEWSVRRNGLVSLNQRSWSAFTDRPCRFDTSKLFKSSSPIRTIYRHQSITIKQLPFNLWYREEIMSFKVVFQGWEGEMDWLHSIQTISPSLPPILHKNIVFPLQRYSKGS